MGEIEEKLIEDLTADIVELMKDANSYTVTFGDPLRHFEIDSLEGAYEEALVGLINSICHTKNYYERFLNKDQLNKVKKIYEEGFYIPNFYDEDEFGRLPVSFDDVENRVTENIALWVKEQNNEDCYPLWSFLEYFEEYGNEEMVKKLKR